MFRKIYLDLAFDALKSGRVFWLMGLGAKYLLTYGSVLTQKPLGGPILGTLVTNYTCNLDCRMCDISRRTGELKGEGLLPFDTEGMKRVILEMKEVGVKGIGFTGGEPLLRKDIFELLAYTKKLGLVTHLNSNGALLDDEKATELVRVGVDSLNISVDGAVSSTHDAIRGVEGSFALATGALRRVAALKQKLGRGPRCKAVMVVQEGNVGELEEFIKNSREWGVEVVEFIPEQPFFLEGMQSRKAAPSDALLESGDKIAEWKRQGVPIENSYGMLKLFRPTFEGLPSPLACTAGYNSIAVDCFGVVYPCVPWVNWGKGIGNVRSGTLKEFWRSPEMAKARKAVGGCRDCTLNCQAELNLLFSR